MEDVGGVGIPAGVEGRRLVHKLVAREKFTTGFANLFFDPPAKVFSIVTVHASSEHEAFEEAGLFIKKSLFTREIGLFTTKKSDGSFLKEGLSLIHI